MFPVDTFQPAYCEARIQADEARRTTEPSPTIKAPVPQVTSQPQSHNLTQAFMQRPPLSRPGSSSVIGSIYQGFVKAATPPPQEMAAAVKLAKLTPDQAEKIREADICANAMRPW